MVFLWGLNDSNPPRVFKILLSIPADFNSVVIWVFSILPLISSSSSLPGSWEQFQVPQLQLSPFLTSCSSAFSALRQGLSSCLVFRLLLFSMWSAGTAKSTIWQVLFLRIKTRIGSVCISKFQKILCFIFLDKFCLVHISFVGMIKFLSLAQFPVDHISNLVLFYLYVSLLLSLITWFTFWYPWLHNIHLLFCCVLLSFALR